MPLLTKTGDKGVTKEEIEKIVEKTVEKVLKRNVPVEDIIKIASTVSKSFEMLKKNEPVMEYLDEQKNTYYRDPNLT